MNRLCISTYSLSRWRKERGKTLEDTIEWIAAQGVPGIEFSGLEDIGTKTAIQLRRRCDMAGLTVASYCVPAEFLVDPKMQAQVVDAMKQAVDVAVVLGAATMRHDVTRGPAEGDNGSLEQVLSTVVPPVRQIAEYARRNGIKTSVENHGFYLQTADRVEQLVRAVGEELFGVTLDMGNFLCLNQDPVDAVRRLAKYAVMVHIKDFYVGPREKGSEPGWLATPTDIALRGAILGEGVIDLRAQLAILRNADYRGWLSLEFEGEEEPTIGVERGLKYLKGVLSA